ncbi:MAG: type II secretion system F family protein [Candidatus Nanopelagicales bacterium]
MGALIGLLFGVGLVLVWDVWGRPRGRRDRTGRHEQIGGAERNARWVKAAASAIGCALIALIATQLPFVALLAGAAGAMLPRIFRIRSQTKLTADRQSAWPDVVDGLTSAVRAGMSLPEAVCAVAYRGPACLRLPFAQFAIDYRATGHFSQSLANLTDTLADPVADRISEALLAARDVGGTDLGRMLRTLSEFLRQDLRLRGEAEARRSWTVNGARLAVAAPWIVLVLLSTRPDAAAAYRTAAGMMLLGFAAAVTALAYMLMSRIGRLPQEQRVRV